MEEVLNVFSSSDLQTKMSDIVKISKALSQKIPVFGFHYAFYVPGWIGLIQQMIVEHKMEKFVKLPFYNDMNYYEFADWIINKSREISEIHIQTKPATDSTEYQIFEMQSHAIVKTFDFITNCWANCCPEVSSYCNLKYTEDTLISPLGLVIRGLEENLKDLGYPQSSKNRRNKGNTFLDDAKSFLYQIGGYILNIFLLAAIFGLLSLFF